MSPAPVEGVVRGHAVPGSRTPARGLVPRARASRTATAPGGRRVRSEHPRAL